MTFSGYKLPFFLKIDKGITSDIVTIIKESNIKFKKAYLVTDKVIDKLYGNKIYEQVKKEYIVHKLIVNDNKISTCISLAESVIDKEFECIIGVGGGKVLDICKYAAAMTKRYFISIPTAIAHDGVASPIAVLKAENGFTKSLGCNVPSGIIIDIDVIKDSPVNLIKAGIGDTLSNYTAIFDWKLSKKRQNENINDFALLLASTATQALINFKNRNLYNDEFIKQLCQSIILSGMAMEIAGSSRPCSGSEHLFSHSIDKYATTKNLHGLQVALGSIVSSYFQKTDYKKLIRFLNEFDIDVNPRQLGITLEEFIYYMKHSKCTRPGRYTIFDEVDLSEKNLNDLYYILCKEV